MSVVAPAFSSAAIALVGNRTRGDRLRDRFFSTFFGVLLVVPSSIASAASASLTLRRWAPVRRPERLGGGTSVDGLFHHGQVSGLSATGSIIGSSMISQMICPSQARLLRR